MADPVTMAAVSIGGSAISGAMGAAGAEQQGQAQSQMYQYQAGVAQINQQIANQNAQYAIAAGESKAQMAGIKTSQEIGAEKAGQGASGLDVNGVSATRVRESTLDVGSLDEATIRSNAARESYNYTVQGWQQGQQAIMDQMAASNAKSAGDMNAMSSIIGGASSVANKWLSYSKAGIFS